MNRLHAYVFHDEYVACRATRRDSRRWESPRGTRYILNRSSFRVTRLTFPERPVQPSAGNNARFRLTVSPYNGTTRNQEKLIRHRNREMVHYVQLLVPISKTNLTRRTNTKDHFFFYYYCKKVLEWSTYSFQFQVLRWNRNRPNTVSRFECGVFFRTVNYTGFLAQLRNSSRSTENYS